MPNIKNALIISFFLVLFISCEKSEKSEFIKGDFYTNESYDGRSICPLYFSFEEDSLFVQYNDTAEKWKFKLDYISSDSIRLSYLDEGETFVKFFKKEKTLILIDTTTSFEALKDTIKLYPLKKDFMKVNELGYDELKGYWHSSDFYPSLRKEQNTWFKIDKDSVHINSNIENEFNYQKYKYQPIYYDNFSLLAILNFGFMSEDIIYSIDYLDENKLRLIYKNCENYKYSIHLKRVDSLQFFNKKLNQKEYPTIEFPR